MADVSAVTYGSGKPFLGGIQSEDARRRWDEIFGPRRPLNEPSDKDEMREMGD